MKNLNLKIARIRKCLTQENLAEKANLSKQYISLLESGKAINPSLKTIRKLAEILEVEIEDIF